MSETASRMALAAEREDAHRLYFNTGLRITSYHFQAPLE